MRVRERYPHHLWEINTAGANSYVGKCREETTGWSPTYSPTVTLFARRNSTVYMPTETRTISEGTEIQVTDDESGLSERVRGICYKYDRGVFCNRMWI